jgi:hypothetical protein
VLDLRPSGPKALVQCFELVVPLVAVTQKITKESKLCIRIAVTSELRALKLVRSEQSVLCFRISKDKVYLAEDTEFTVDGIIRIPHESQHI